MSRILPKRLSVLLPLLALAGCAPREPVEIEFEALYGGQPFSCETAVGDRQLTDLRFYVSDIVLIDSDGREAPLLLDPVAGWQEQGVALVDLENGRDACTNGTAAMRVSVQGRLAASRISGLRFTLGVPEALNHGDPLTAPAPLQHSGMHWHWRSGYKFLRAGVAGEEGSAWLHLGSARCHGEIGALEGCDAANRARIELPGFMPGEHRVGVDLAALLGADLPRGGGDVSCQVGPDEVICADWLPRLGIDPVTGEATRTAGPFRIRPRP